jgi:spermidine synthase
VVSTESQDRTGTPARLAWMWVFFVLSGLSGLIYQSIWSQYLSLLLGSAAYAQSLVLIIFMGGMALGAWLSTRLVARTADLLRMYGLIEGAIGFIGIGFHALFLAVSHWLYDRWLPGLTSPETITLSRWLVAAVLILPQTVLLGMTFPIMSAGLMRWLPDRAGVVLGGLYFFNSIGAAFGALIATFFLVPFGGLPGAMAVAGAINILILAGVLMSRVPARTRHDADAALAESTIGERAMTPETSGFYRFMLLAAGLTGLSSFMYEIGWIRMLSLALGSSLHAFELMLASFIGGLALGGLYVRGRLDRSPNPVRYVGYVQVLMGVAALATLPLYDHAFVAVGGLMKTLAPSASGYFFYNVATAVVSIVIMLPAAFFAGMTLPIITFALLRRGVGERAVGHTYAANTFGAIIGVLLMMHWALPVLGLKISMVVAAAIDLLLGLALLRISTPRLPVNRIAVTGAIAALAAVAAVTLADFDPRRLHSGVYRTSKAELDAQRKVLYSRDGKTASISLHGIPDKTLTIATNGKPDASLTMSADDPPSADEPTMILAALLGLAYHPAPLDVANIGFGSGLTTHTFAQSSLPASITSVEIEPKMVEAARGFGARVIGAYDDPRSRIVIDDARAYFSGHGNRYDVIISEPSNPWVAGVAKLFSVEFYAFAKRHLKEGGLLVQWVQSYEIADATLLSLLRALDAEFADYTLYLSNGTDILIVASPTAKLPRPNSRFLEDPALRELAQIAGIRGLSDLEERKLADKSIVEALLRVDGGPTNSDFRPVLGHWAPRDRFMRSHAGLILGLFDSPFGIYSRLGHYPANDAATWYLPQVEVPQVTRRRQAEEIASILLDVPMQGGRGDTDDDQRLRGLAWRARELGQSCFAGVGTRAATSVVVQLFQATAPFLDEARLRSLWIEAPWRRCEVAPADVMVATFDVFGALIDRDGERLEASSWLVLNTLRKNLHPEFAPYFAHAALYSGAMRGDGSAFKRVMAFADRDLDLTPRGRMELLLTASVLQLEGSKAR